jgi:antitoxin MazE
VSRRRHFRWTEGLTAQPQSRWRTSPLHSRYWGNSAAVRIPASVMTAALGLDQAVNVREEGGRIVIEPIQAEACDLNTRLDRMRPETFPEDIGFGPPQGREIW